MNARMLSPLMLLLAALSPALGQTLSGELKQWHKVTLTLTGPHAHETDLNPNPFTDYRMTVTFRHSSGSPEYQVPGYFAADGDAANTSADSGNQWRSHLSPDKAGEWSYHVSFVKGGGVALDPAAQGVPVAGSDAIKGSFHITATDKQNPDLRAKGRLRYVGKHHLQFAGTGEYFLKAGPDSPENLLAYADFDATASRKKPNAPQRQGEAAPGKLHQYTAHLKDWRDGDPTWKNGKGKALLGALNYLSSKGLNSFSFLPYNVGGDGDDVWPFASPTDKLHYDCSKLDQWQIVFDHAQRLGLHLHFKMQETEMDDNRHGNSNSPVPSALDGGDLGPERKLYCRELIARFSHELALNWNLGEENTQSPEQQRAMAQYIRDLDPYDHHIVIHTYPDWQDRVYPPLLGSNSVLTGASLQNDWSTAHARTLKWVDASVKAGKPWVAATDEQGPADMGVPPDPGFAGSDGKASHGGKTYTLDDVRKLTLWGNLMAGGAGVEYYFGYKLPQNDLACEDWRSRDRSWDYCRIALDFFRSKPGVPFWEMQNADALIGNPRNDNSRFCFAKPGSVYVVYLPNGGTTDLDLGQSNTTYTVRWFNPRSGGPLLPGSVQTIRGPGKFNLGQPPSDPQQDWTLLITRQD